MTRRKKRERAAHAPMAIPFLSQSRLEIKYFAGGKKGVLVCDCEEILAYSHEKVMFRLRRECITVTGRELWCRSYGNRVAEVIGYVENVSFGGGAM